MKSIKNVNGNTQKQSKYSSLASIDTQQYIKYRRQKMQVPCAFHVHEVITNFCLNASCLLPLCPKCVKIHTQEHKELGTFAKFESIQDCLDEAHNCLINSQSSINKLQQMSSQIQLSYVKKKQQTIKQFERIRQYAFECLSNAFDIYAQVIKQQIQKQEETFTQALIGYHEGIGAAIDSVKVISQKFNAKNSIMQGLIGFYSKHDVNLLLKQCEEKLNRIQMCKIQLSTDNRQLQKLKQIVQRYVKLGDNTTLSSNTINQINKETSIMSSLSNIDRNPARTNSEIDPAQRFSILQCNYQNLQTPLDRFSLQRSRHTRLSFKKSSYQQ